MTTILLDADIVAYKVASLNQDDFDWGDTGTSRVVDHARAIKDTEEVVAQYANALDASSVLVCLSDPAANWRKELDASYKANRKDVAKPELLQWVKDYLAHEYRSFIRPRLEADDVMGILATSGDRFIKGDRIIVSEDKDMLTIPARVWNPRHPERGVVEVDRLSADRWHLTQALTGDPVDGYPGCRGVGIKSPFVAALQQAEGVDMWAIVVEAFESKGFTADDALLQARLAHICRASSYNFKTRRVRLWRPQWLSL